MLRGKWLFVALVVFFSLIGISAAYSATPLRHAHPVCAWTKQEILRHPGLTGLRKACLAEGNRPQLRRNLLRGCVPTVGYPGREVCPIPAP